MVDYVLGVEGGVVVECEIEEALSCQLGIF